MHPSTQAIQATYVASLRAGALLAGGRGRKAARPLRTVFLQVFGANHTSFCYFH